MSKMAIIANANLVTHTFVLPGGGADACTGNLQKAILLAVAATEGQAITFHELGAMASCSKNGIYRGLHALFDQGLVGHAPHSVGRRRRKRRVYRIDWAALTALIPGDKALKLDEAIAARSELIQRGT